MGGRQGAVRSTRLIPEAFLDARPDPRDALLAAVRHHAATRPDQADVAARFAAFIADNPDCCERSLPAGHLTGSAWLVSRDGRRVLLTHHRKRGKWLQLGGHADGDHDLARVALREAEEESGLRDLVVEPAIFDLDCHWIPARKADPGHYHWDMRYVVRARGDETFTVSDESHALAWRDIAELVDEPGLDNSVRRMAGEWMRRATTG
jgi:8-oxo-dGTP pyrophosphatase MutT (NUDIX family)